MSEILAAIIGAVVGGITGSFCTWIMETPARRRGVAAEKELKEIKRRAEAPLWIPTRREIHSLQTAHEPLVFQYGSQERRRLLDSVLVEIKPESIAGGVTVVFGVDNVGAEARTTKVEEDSHQIVFREESEDQGSEGRRWLEYPYDPAKHGSEQRFRINYQTGAGTMDIHTYVLKHGLRELWCVDPPQSEPRQK